MRYEEFGIQTRSVVLFALPFPDGAKNIRRG